MDHTISKTKHKLRRKMLPIVILFISTLTGSSSVQRYTECDEYPCPTWQTNASGICTCSTSNAGGMVQCSNHPYRLNLQRCSCITCLRGKQYVGACLYSCKKHGLFYEFNITSSVCEEYNRQDAMCGRCIPGNAPPVYSYSISCVNCTASNLVKFSAVSFLPLTAFFIFVLTFRISANNPMLYGLILCLQLLMSPNSMRFIDSIQLHHKSEVVNKLVFSIFGVWNLDFFRLVYSPFCLFPDTNNLQILSLDYVIAVYPLFLIGLSYFLVMLYDYNYRVVVFLCKPLIRVFIRLRRQWNIRNSLVDAFATFLLLSYVKILSVSLDLLAPGVLFNKHNHSPYFLRVFNQGNIGYFSSEHLPYACLAIFFLTTFTLLPVILLFIYPCTCFQRCLNNRGWTCQSLHIFMDSLQGYYKSGLNGTRDLRCFSALFLVLRILTYTSYFLAYMTKSYAYTTAIVLTFIVITVYFKPFKQYYHNVIMTVMLYSLAFSTLFYLPYSEIDSHYGFVHYYPTIFHFVLLFLLVYMLASFLLMCVPSRFLKSVCYSRVCLKIKNKLHSFTRTNNFSHSPLQTL